MIKYNCEGWNNIEDLEGEIWEPVIGWEDRYAVSNYGRLKGFWIKPFRLCRIQVHNDEFKKYLVIALCKNKKKYKTGVHRLVAQAFIPNPEDKPEVNHIDGDKQNNRVENLEWVTGSENMRHSFANGRKPKRGEGIGTSVLKEEQVLRIRELYDNGFSNMQMRRTFSISESTVSRIIKRESWQHI